MNFNDVLKTTAAVLTLLGGSGAIILGLSNWLGKVWAERLMQDQRFQHEQSLARLRSDLERATSSELEGLRSKFQGEMDAVMRRRAVYERISLAMRVFLQGKEPASEAEKREFLKAYDLSVLWAPDSVLATMGKFLDLQQAFAIRPEGVSQEAMKLAYADCLMEMRKDVGFPQTPREIYRVVRF